MLNPFRQWPFLALLFLFLHAATSSAQLKRPPTDQIFEFAKSKKANPIDFSLTIMQFDERFDVAAIQNSGVILNEKLLSESNQWISKTVAELNAELKAVPSTIRDISPSSPHGNRLAGRPQIQVDEKPEHLKQDRSKRTLPSPPEHSDRPSDRLQTHDSQRESWERHRQHILHNFRNMSGGVDFGPQEIQFKFYGSQKSAPSKHLQNKQKHNNVWISIHGNKFYLPLSKDDASRIAQFVESRSFTLVNLKIPATRMDSILSKWFDILKIRRKVSTKIMIYNKLIQDIKNNKEDRDKNIDDLYILMGYDYRQCTDLKCKIEHISKKMKKTFRSLKKLGDTIKREDIRTRIKTMIECQSKFRKIEIHPAFSESEQGNLLVAADKLPYRILTSIKESVGLVSAVLGTFLDTSLHEPYPHIIKKESQGNKAEKSNINNYRSPPIIFVAKENTLSVSDKFVPSIEFFAATDYKKSKNNQYLSEWLTNNQRRILCKNKCSSVYSYLLTVYHYQSLFRWSKQNEPAAWASFIQPMKKKWNTVKHKVQYVSTEQIPNSLLQACAYLIK